MTARAFLAAAFLCLFAGTGSIPIIQPSDTVCQSLSTACGDLLVASSCKTLKPCIEIWQRLPVPIDQSKTCNICKEMVKEARDQLLTNETQEELRQVFEGSCQLLLIEPVVKLCKQIVDDFIPDLIDILVSSLDPDQVCTIAGLCSPNFYNKQRLQQSLMLSAFQSRIFLPTVREAVPSASVMSSERCPRCTESLKHAKAMIQMVPEAYIELLVLDICERHAEGFAAQCPSIVKSYVFPIYDYIYDTNVDQMCVDLKKCPATATLKPKAPLVTPNDDLTCDFCRQVVGSVRQRLSSHAIRDEIKQVLLNFCEDLGQVAEECQNMIQEYFEVVYTYILDALDPSVFCPAIGLCPASRMPVPLVKMFPATMLSKSHLLKVNYPKKANDTTPKAKEVVAMVKVHPGIPVKYLNKEASKKSVNESDNPLCEMCTFVMQYLEAALKDKKNKDAIKKVLEEACQLVPKDKRQSCINMVDQYVDDVVTFIVNDLDPKTVCTLLHLCPNDQLSDVKIHTAETAEKGKVWEDPECMICKFVLEFLEHNLPGNATAEAVEEVLDQLCNLLPQEAADECRDFVDKNIEMIVRFLSGEMGPWALCHLITLCAAPPPKQVSPDCVLCKEIVQVVYDQLKDKRTEEEIKKVLDGVCDLLPPSAKENCLAMVNTYYDLLITLILQDLTPAEVCAALKFCPPSLQKVSQGGGPGCDICKTIIQMVYDRLEDNKTEEAIRKTLEEVCSLLPSGDREKCKNLVDEYSSILLAMILADYSPEKICAVLRLCPSSSTGTTTSEKHSTKDSPACALCENVVQFIYSELNDTRTEEDIKKVLSEVCNWVPKSDKKQCENMVNTYFDLLVSLILQDFTPEQICQTLTFCPSRSHGPIQCTFCEYALHFIQNELMDNATEENIKNILDQLCSMLPDEMADECQAFIEEYGPSLLALLAQELDPSIVCVAIRACPKDGLPKQSKALENLHLNECDRCTVVVDYVERILRDIDNDSEIVAASEGICSKVHPTIREGCRSLVETYGPSMLRNLGELGNSRRVCQKIKICSETSAHLLGSKKCTFGPTYWCHSDAHAAACSAQEYCKRKVWKQ